MSNEDKNGDSRMVRHDELKELLDKFRGEIKSEMGAERHASKNANKKNPNEKNKRRSQVLSLSRQRDFRNQK